MAERPKERLYREEEVAEILQRAARNERRRQDEKPALSLAEIEAIAREPGMDPLLVRNAAREMEVRKTSGLPSPCCSRRRWRLSKSERPMKMRGFRVICAGRVA
jgi:hypothetical protein